MIYGIGHDVLEIPRLQRLLDGRHGTPFIERVLTPQEQALARERGQSAEFIGGRFAAKEAITKAFGCGIGGVIGFSDLNIVPDEKGKPLVQLNTAAWERLGLSAAEHVIHLSITHQPGLASAFAVVEAR
ncbi:holo-ACP synthase [Paenibacillus sp. JX-17]|uniref:Holo-[acyl-carrier-protein] synthase n=1 Tax=Paenibacillus lacisoli TaxID=3064525 RepID=A0ABT9CG50_9BACL|nr:holo-ACP synthase [Paenibacillus sp. JX-17]MDO7908264.1 holo-ACP synthase [Paenibacillus sp. JX-17]